MSRKRHINEYLKTTFANSGRVAGAGISYDRYDDESGNPCFIRKDKYPRLPSDSLTRKEWEALNGDVITYKEDKQC